MCFARPWTGRLCASARRALRTCSPADTLAILLDARLELPHLAPMYRVTPATAVAEATAAARVVSEVAHRLQRLRHAYGAWEQFEPGPYFDLTSVQTARLVHVVERVSTVYVVFFVDALLPSFQAVVGAFATLPMPAGILDEIAMQQRIAEHWRRLIVVLTQARQLLTDNVAYLATNGASEERQRWAAWWRLPAQAGLPARLAADMPTAPTLTLSIEFPLPAARQPGRLRRLRRTWDRQQQSRQRK